MEAAKFFEPRNVPGVLEFFGLPESDAGMIMVEPGPMRPLEKTRWEGLKGFSVTYIVTLASNADSERIEKTLKKKIGFLIA